MDSGRIILDGMGGDNAPDATIEGAVQAARSVSRKIVIVGDEEAIRKGLASRGYKGDGIEVVHAEEVITGHEAPVKAVRTKTRSSMVVGLNMVKNKEGGVFISAGNTGAIMAGGLFILGRIQGIDRPTLAAPYPIASGSVALLVDSGANSECKPKNLLEFANMGSIYMEKVLGVENPRIGLVNMGTEESKGTTVLKAAHELLCKSRDEYGTINFVGNVEARELPNGVADVIVCDGFVGNVILKLTEGFAGALFKQIKKKFTEGVASKVGALLLSGKIKELRSMFDYSEYGGAPILGVKGAVVKIHGSSDATTVKNAIIKSVPYMENEVVQCIENAVLEMEEIAIDLQD